MTHSRPEAWLRGPVPDVPALLQPVAHALLQAREEVSSLLDGFPEDLLWARPAGVASVGFHVRHLSGVVDRLFTYARGVPLSPSQLHELETEASPPDPAVTVQSSWRVQHAQVERAIAQLRTTDSRTLEPRTVGRSFRRQCSAPVHAAEHIQRHLGQLLVTVAFRAQCHWMASSWRMNACNCW
jgi:hypothetical protein